MSNPHRVQPNRPGGAGGDASGAAPAGSGRASSSKKKQRAALLAARAQAQAKAPRTGARGAAPAGSSSSSPPVVIGARGSEEEDDGEDDADPNESGEPVDQPSGGGSGGAPDRDDSNADRSQEEYDAEASQDTNATERARANEEAIRQDERDRNGDLLAEILKRVQQLESEKQEEAQRQKQLAEQLQQEKERGKQEQTRNKQEEARLREEFREKLLQLTSAMHTGLMPPPALTAAPNDAASAASIKQAAEKAAAEAFAYRNLAFGDAQRPLTSTKLEAIKPDELTLTSVRQDRALETFLFKCEGLCRDLTIDPAREPARAIAIAMRYMSMDLQRVTESYIADRAGGGLPAFTWAGFKAAMQAWWVSKTEQEKALAELYGMTQGERESADDFCLRFDLLLTRIGQHPGKPQETALVAMALSKVNGARYPLAKRECQKEVRDGTIMTWPRLRQALTEKATFEPQSAIEQARAELARSRPAAFTAGGRSSGKKYSTNAVAAAGTEGEVQVNAMQIRGKCFKCGEEGHFARDCTSAKDIRVCHWCKKPGHMQKNCASRRDGKPKATAEAATAGSSN
jgi:hypothetical protein